MGAEPCGSTDALSFLLSMTEDGSDSAAAPPATGSIETALTPKKEAFHQVQHLG